MYKPYKFNWIGIILALFFYQVQAQEPTGVSDNNQNQSHSIITDRPDATESPNTVQPGYVQIETGGYYTSYENAGVKTETHGLLVVNLYVNIVKRFKDEPEVN